MNDFLSVSPWTQLAVGFGRADLYPLLDHIHITIFGTALVMGLSVPLSAHSFNLRAGDGSKDQ